MTYRETLDYLENNTQNRKRPDPVRMKELCRRLGEPQKELRFVHVAGSNGKGSTCAMIASVLEAAGHRTGLYISPYIQVFGERIQINGENIPDDRLAETVSRVRSAADEMEDQPSWFETLTAAAFLYYMEEKCDIVVLETGMGGRDDATNVIDAPEVAVMTNIGLEHTDFLGDTLEQIAGVKCGIIKPGSIVISYDNTPEVKAVIRAAADACGDSAVFARAGDIRLTGRDLSGQSFIWKESNGGHGAGDSLYGGAEYRIPLQGEHQLSNAAVALETIDALARKGWDIPAEAVNKGLARVKWPARFQLLAEEPVVILDGGHNPQCTEVLTDCLGEIFPGQKVELILGVMAEKDHDRMLDLLTPYAARVYCVAPDSERAMPPKTLAENVTARGVDAEAYPDDAQEEMAGEGRRETIKRTGLRRALEAGLDRAAGEGRPLVCYGSLYLAGEILDEFGGVYKKWLRKRKIQARESLTEEERLKYSEEICRRIAGMPGFADAETVFIYNWMRGEVRLDTLAETAEAHGKRIVYPKCVSGTEMIAVQPGQGSSAWTSGAFGIREPDPEKGSVIPPDEIDFVVCPCSSFDAGCRRLGMGGGYYDRYLPFCTKANIVAAAFETQRAERIPADAKDVPVDAVITEKCIYSTVERGQDY